MKISSQSRLYHQHTCIVLTSVMRVANSPPTRSVPFNACMNACVLPHPHRARLLAEYIITEADLTHFGQSILLNTTNSFIRANLYYNSSNIILHYCYYFESRLYFPSRVNSQVRLLRLFLGVHLTLRIVPIFLLFTPHFKLTPGCCIDSNSNTKRSFACKYTYKKHVVSITCSILHVLRLGICNANLIFC